MMNGLRLLLNSRVSAAVLIAVVALFIWLNRGLLFEDGMIYARYAFNLTEGYGLVYNPGEYYESNTNFLWTLLMLPIFWLNLEAVTAIQLLGVGIAAAVLILVYEVVRLLSSGAVGLLAVLLLGFHATFILNATNGFAPHLAPVFVLTVMVLSLRYAKNPHIGYAAAMTVALSLLLITRLDAVLLFGVVWLMALWVVWNVATRQRKHFYLIGIVPPLVFAVYLLCKFLYYGDIFPATYYAKAGDKIPAFYDFIGRGLIYVRLYVQTYLFTVIIPLCLCFAVLPMVRHCRQFGGVRAYLCDVRVLVLCACALLVAVQALYMLRVGGDGEKIRFRFLLTIAPFLFILLVSALRTMPRYIAAVCVVIMLGVSLQHYRTAGDYVSSLKKTDLNFSPWPGDLVFLALRSGDALFNLFAAFGDYQSETVLATPTGNFSYREKTEEVMRSRFLAGTGLRRHFAGFGDYPPDIKIATSAGGVLPFHSRLYVLEMHGWADTRLFEEGNYHIGTNDWAPGHQLMATPAFVKKLGINLVLGHPLFTEDGVGLPPDKARSLVLQFFGIVDDGQSALQAENLPADMQFVLIPIAENKNLVALYFIRNKTLDDFFERHQFVRYDINLSR